MRTILHSLISHILVIPVFAAGFQGGADLIITLKPSLRNSETVLALCGEYYLSPKYPDPVHGIIPVRLPGGVSLETALSMLESDSRIEKAEPDYIIHAAAMPDDPLFRKQWHLFNRGSRTDIHAPEAWEIQEGKKDVIVAIIDTGIDYLHPDLKANMWTNPGEIPGNERDDDGNGFRDDIHGWSFADGGGEPMDRHFHGTMVAGIAGAVTGNKIGIAGVMHRCRLMAVKGLGDFGFGYSSDLIAAIYYAVDNGADVINASWGGGGYQQAMEDALEYAAQHNVLFVAAAGNSGANNDRQPFYPASYSSDNIVSVGASNQEDLPAGFSQWGRNSVDLFAPGVNILSTYPGGSYRSNAGTSLAAPIVTGCLGLLISSAPGVPYPKYIRALLESVHPVPALKPLCVSGGRLDVRALLDRRFELFQTVSASRTYRSALYGLSRLLAENKGGHRP